MFDVAGKGLGQVQSIWIRLIRTSLMDRRTQPRQHSLAPFEQVRHWTTDRMGSCVHAHKTCKGLTQAMVVDGRCASLQVVSTPRKSGRVRPDPNSSAYALLGRGFILQTCGTFLRSIDVCIVSLINDRFPTLSIAEAIRIS